MNKLTKILKCIKRIKIIVSAPDMPKLSKCPSSDFDYLLASFYDKYPEQIEAIRNGQIERVTLELLDEELKKYNILSAQQVRRLILNCREKAKHWKEMGAI